MEKSNWCVATYKRCQVNAIQLDEEYVEVNPLQWIRKVLQITQDHASSVGHLTAKTEVRDLASRIIPVHVFSGNTSITDPKKPGELLREMPSVSENFTLH